MIQHIWRTKVITVLSALCMVLPQHVLAEEGDATCETHLAEAEEMYVDGEFDATIRILSSCFYRDDLEPALSTEIGRLVALAHMNKDELDAARRSVLRILSFDSNYQADPIQDPPSYASMVNLVRGQVRAGELDVAEIPREKRNRDWIYIVGGGVLTVAVSTIIAVLSEGNGDPRGDVNAWAEPVAVP